MDIFALYATNEKAEEEGRYFDLGDASFLIARANNTRFDRMMTKEMEAHKHTLDLKGSEDADTARETCSKGIMIRVMSKSVLLGWKGNVQFQGQPLPFNSDNAAKLLGVKDFQNWVHSKSRDFNNYLEVDEAADEKNSLTTSDGTSNGDLSLTTSTTSSEISA